MKTRQNSEANGCGSVRVIDMIINTDYTEKFKKNAQLDSNIHKDPHSAAEEDQLLINNITVFYRVP